jgi:hypothetical protein
VRIGGVETWLRIVSVRELRVSGFEHSGSGIRVIVRFE